MNIKYFDWFVYVVCLHSHRCGRVVSASGSETSVSSSMPTSAIICDAYTSIIKKNIKTVLLFPSEWKSDLIFDLKPDFSAKKE